LHQIKNLEQKMGAKSEEQKSNRKLAIARDQCQCRVCSAPWGLQFHHIIHKSKGGHDTVDNLITLCSDCHLIVHNQLKSLIKSGVDVLKYRYIILLLK
jgi:5-methylcytosine-specific restriction endonuclease McrA